MAEFNLGTLTETPVYRRDFVGNTDSSDTFSFRLANNGNINISLTGMSADADVTVFRDFNGNGIVDSGDTQVGSSTRGANIDDSISIADQQAGSYVAQVYRYSGNTNYDLRLSTTPSHLDPPSNLLPNEFEVDTLTSSRTFTNSDLSEGLSNNDTSDVFHFNVNQARNYRFSLTGLSADADIRLIQDSNSNRVVEPNQTSMGGEVLGVSRNGGTTDDSITLFLNPGDYYVQVYQFANANINYTLNMTPV